MIPPLLAHWGYTQADMDELTRMLRTSRHDGTSGPPTKEEEGLILMVLVADRLQQAGYETQLRWVGGEPEVRR